MFKALVDRLTEAFADKLDKMVRIDPQLWGYAQDNEKWTIQQWPDQDLL